MYGFVVSWYELNTSYHHERSYIDIECEENDMYSITTCLLIYLCSDTIVRSIADTVMKK